MAGNFDGASFDGAIGGFDVDSSGSAPGVVGRAGGTARFFTPVHALPGRKKRRQIEKLVAKEAALKERIEEYQQKQFDVDTLQSLYDSLKELQLELLRVALESQAAAFYIEKKRNEEEDDEVMDIIKMLDLL